MQHHLTPFQRQKLRHLVAVSDSFRDATRSLLDQGREKRDRLTEMRLVHAPKRDSIAKLRERARYYNNPKDSGAMALREEADMLEKDIREDEGDLEQSIRSTETQMEAINAGSNPAHLLVDRFLRYAGVDREIQPAVRWFGGVK